MANMIRSTQVKSLTSASLHDIPKVKKSIKSKLPNLQSRDIRRYKKPYSEVVVLELQEDGFYEAAEYFQFLFGLDAEMRDSAGPNTIIWNKPWLKDNKELIDVLREVLIMVFDTQKAAESRTMLMMDTALFVENSGWEWYWISDTLYRSAFYIAKQIDTGDREIINVLRYLYARFLFFKMKKAKSALEYIRQAQQESRDKSWNASRILGSGQENLFRESCKLSCKVLQDIAREVRENDPKTSLDSCKVALSCAIESDHEELVAEAHHEFGESEVAAGNLEQAIEHFYESLVILKKLCNSEGVCGAHAKLALTFQEIGDKEKVLEHLQKLKDDASNFNLPYKLAEGNFLTGKYYFAQDNFEEAIPNFEVAFSLYHRLGAKDEANHIRCLIGISKGQLLMEDYQALIKRSVQGDSDALLKLILWRDCGEPFL